MTAKLRSTPGSTSSVIAAMSAESLITPMKIAESPPFGVLSPGTRKLPRLTPLTPAELYKLGLGMAGSGAHFG